MHMHLLPQHDATRNNRHACFFSTQPPDWDICSRDTLCVIPLENNNGQVSAPTSTPQLSSHHHVKSVTLLRALSAIHRSGKCKVWAGWQPGNKLPPECRKLMFKFQDAQGMLLLHLLHLLSHAAKVKRHHYCTRCNNFFSAGNEQTVYC